MKDIQLKTKIISNKLQGEILDRNGVYFRLIMTTPERSEYNRRYYYDHYYQCIENSQRQAARKKQMRADQDAEYARFKERLAATPTEQRQMVSENVTHERLD